MNSHRYSHQPVVVHLTHPLRDWTFRIAGVCLFLGVFALGAYLQEPDVEPEPPQVTFNRGLVEGRRQIQLAYAERNRQAFQAGMDEAYMRCNATGGRK